MVRIAGCLLLLLCLASSVQADAPCPQSCITLGYSPAVCSALSARDTTQYDVCPTVPGTYIHRGQYSLVLGTVRADARSCYTVTASAEVVARDRFRLVGPSGGGPIAFEARLYVNGAGHPFGNASAGISETGGGSRSVTDVPYGGFNEILVLPVEHEAGEEFELVYNATANGGDTAYSLGNLSFVLPPGYGVTSCGGYQGDGAVPTRARSWGTLKVRYR